MQMCRYFFRAFTLYCVYSTCNLDLKHEPSMEFWSTYFFRITKFNPKTHHSLEIFQSTHYFVVHPFFSRIFCGKSANGFSCPHSFWPIHKELIKIAFSELKILFRSFCTIFNGGECNASRNRMIGCFPWIYLDLCSETTTFQCVFGKRALCPPPPHEQIQMHLHPI